ncbi:hypothetical protein ACTVOX_21995 [Serratia marcescens]|uniref:hypothetical protein n=1 Tax=Serratia marcescens TaxID=615 RepID=UPI003FA7C409
MSSGKLHFKGICPKCNNKNTFFIEKVNYGSFPGAYSIFHFDKWRVFCFYPFSIVSTCSKCRQYVCANISVNNDKITDDSILNNYSDTDGELKESENLIINFDIQPLIPPQPIESSHVTSSHDLYEQAVGCFKIRAWDAVGIVCRKIVDIETQKLWRLIHPFDISLGVDDKKNRIPDLAERLEKLLVPEIRGGNKENIARSEIYKHINHDEFKHKIFYSADSLRTNGNEAAHGIIIFGQDDAEHSLIEASYFIDLVIKVKSNK